MPSRKRAHDEMVAPEAQNEPSLLTKIRNTWEFANIMQYIYIFGKAVKIDEDLSIEDLEEECCKPEPSKVLADIGLALLKYVSSHRGLTPQIFDEYTRRQYVAKAPHKNPFGVEDEPKQFANFGVFLKLKVLVQLSQWTLNNAERIREKMEERGELQQALQWRVNEIGYDRHDRNYYALDDNRLYRRTDPPPLPAPTPKSKAKSKKARGSTRAGKRRKTRQTVEEEEDPEEDVSLPPPDEEHDGEPAEDDGFGGMTWECVAITLVEYQSFLSSIAKSRDPNEKALYQSINEDILPIIEAAEASQMRKQLKRERELLNMQKLATAKRSSRLEAKAEKDRLEREAQEVEEKKTAELAEAEAYQKKQQKLDMDRESRMMTREQRIKEREMKRILHEQELARMAEEEKKVDAGESRLSERHLKSEIDKRKKELASLKEEDDWTFDCSKCGKHGSNWDDGTHSVACERCSVWQHSACLGISQADAEKDDFHFVCQDCRRREEDAKKPKIPMLKFRVNATSLPQERPAVLVPSKTINQKRKMDGEQTGSPQRKHKSAEPIYGTFHASSSQPYQGLSNGAHLPVVKGQGVFGQSNLPNPLHNAATPFSPSDKANANADGHGRSGMFSSQPPSQSFQRPPFRTNDYQPYTHQSSPIDPRQYSSGQQLSPLQPHQPRHGQHAIPQPGWSARYIPSPNLAAAQSPNGNSRLNGHPVVRDTLEGRQTSITNDTGPAHQAQRSLYLNSGFANSPNLLNTPHSNFENRPAPSSASPQVNGFPVYNETQPIGPPSQSPVKQSSPPAARSPHARIPPSTSFASQPSFPPQAPSPGFSPVKHSSPPQQQIHPLDYGAKPSNVTALPPIATLSPSSLTQPSLPQKKPSPSQTHEKPFSLSGSSVMSEDGLALKPKHLLPNPEQTDTQ